MTLCVKAKTDKELEMNTFVDVSSCMQSFSEINLKNNYTKPTFIKIKLSQQHFELRQIVLLDNDPQERTCTTKFLEVYVNQGLTWGDQVDHLCPKVSSGIHSLRSLAKKCS